MEKFYNEESKVCNRKVTQLYERCTYQECNNNTAQGDKTEDEIDYAPDDKCNLREVGIEGYETCRSVI